MKHIIIVILLALSATAATAQNAQTIAVQALIPPEKKIDFGGRDVAIVAIHYFRNADEGRAGGLVFDSTLVNTIADGIKEALEESPVFSNSDLSIFNLYSDTSMLTKPMDIDELASVSEQGNAKIVVAIQFANLFANYTYGYDKTKPMVTNVSFTVLINAYDSETGEVAVKYYSKDKVRLSAEYDQNGNVIPAPEKDEALAITAEMIGKDFAGRLIPEWKNVQRIVFYDSQNSNMRQAYDKVVNSQNWESAMEYWTKELDNKNSKYTQAQLMYNLALGCEVLGNFDLSLKWLEGAKGLSSRMDDYLDEYIKIIKQRIADKAEIESIYD